jgi:preprotein translocase subunit YajC
MLSMLSVPAQLLAQETTKVNPVAQFLPILLIGGAMYFLLIRPQQRRRKEALQLVSSIAEGDEVITTGGIYGFISAIDGDVMWLDIAENVEIRVHRSSIARKIDPVKEPAGGEPIADAAPATATDDEVDGDGDSQTKKK